ncbi:hypothetical protein KAI04_04270 [Candidatus Pacearchaeota archaeon]|nr:hypothetical protein [Candidatus Pacearchaeota archaeon]
MKTTKQKIKQKEDELKVLKKKLIEEQNKKDFIYIKELDIEVQKEKHHLNKSYDDLKEEFGEELEENLLTFNEAQKLRNLEAEGKYKLGLKDTWEFCKQEDIISKKKGRVARFYADSDGLDLGADWSSDYSFSDLGVRFVRRNIKNKK